MYAEPSGSGITPEEVIDEILCVVGIECLRQIIEVLKLYSHGTGSDLCILDGAESVEPLRGLSGVGGVVLGSPHVQEHVLTELLHDIGTYALRPVDVLQGLALGDVTAPERLIDAVGVDGLDTVAEEGLQRALNDLNGTVALLILIVVTELEVALHLVEVLLIADTVTESHVLHGSGHGEHRHKDKLLAILLERLAQFLRSKGYLRIHHRLTKIQNRTH